MIGDSRWDSQFMDDDSLIRSNPQSCLIRVLNTARSMEWHGSNQRLNCYKDKWISPHRLLQMGANIQETAALCTMVHMRRYHVKHQASIHAGFRPFLDKTHLGQCQWPPRQRFKQYHIHRMKRMPTGNCPQVLNFQIVCLSLLVG